MRLGQRLRRERLAVAGSRRSVFFHRAGVYAAVAGGIAGVLAGNAALTWIAAIVLVAAAVGALWNRYALARIAWSMRLSAPRAFPGDVIELALTVANDKPLPLPSVSVETELSPGLEAPDATTVVGVANRRSILRQTRLGPYERVTWRLPVRCAHRGVHVVGPSALRASDPLGFFTSKRDDAGEQAVIVYPRVHHLPRLELPVRFTSGELRAPKQLVADPLRVVGVRDYLPDDPLKSIHWKASARQGRLQVRVTEPTTTLQFAVLANIETFNRYWEGIDVQTAEEVIETAASLAVAALERRWSVGLWANGMLAGHDQPLRIGIGRAPEQRMRILDGLARVSPYSTVGFARFLGPVASRLPRGSTACIVTSLLPEGAMALMAGMIAAGLTLVLVPVGACPTPALRGLKVWDAAAMVAVPPADAPEWAHG